MSIPASYTEKTLADFMHNTLGKVATLLGFESGVSDAGDYEEAVNNALLAYGATDVTGIEGTSNLTKLRALSRVAAWQMAVDNLAALSGFSADGGTYNREQLHAMATKNLEKAQNEAMAYDPNYMVTRRKIDPIHDPYQYRENDERVL